MKRVNYTLFAILLLPCLLSAQPKWEWAVLGGGANYLGDLVEKDLPVWKETQPAAGLYASHFLGYRWAIRTHAFYGQLSGNDDNFSQEIFTEERNFRFRSYVTEVGLCVVWEPFGKARYPTGGGYRRIISPYGYIGGAASYIEARPDFSATQREVWYEKTQQDMQSELSGLRWAIPLGGGLKFDIGKYTSINLELGVRKVFSDHVDGVSYSANPGRDDWYLFGLVGLAKRFGEYDTDRDRIVNKKDACPHIFGVLSARGCPDEDGDGVEDLEDACPTEVGLRELGGCPDADGDGVIDKLDACPKESGPAKLRGCPDSDGDGIADRQDACPNEAGPAHRKGCPDPDSDADGIVDRLDRCPGEAGWADCNGCPFADSDADGVADVDDRCPDTRGYLGQQGCLDSDKDGIIDPLDKCPDISGVKANSGCPPLPEKARKILTTAMQSVQFETGSAVIKKQSYAILNQVAEILSTYDYYQLSIEGHTDSRGNDKANQALSENRAGACLNYLARKGIARERMSVKGWGEIKPVSTNKTDKGRRLNRRVEFRLYLK